MITGAFLNLQMLSKVYIKKFVFSMFDYAPGMTMAGALSVTLSVRTLRTYVRLSQGCPLSKSNTFDQNFMKLGHIVKYHNVFFKFDNGPYRTRLSVVMALC